jgi:hypothetical protein
MSKLIVPARTQPMPRARRGVRLNPPMPSEDAAASITLQAQRTAPSTNSPTANGLCMAPPSKVVRCKRKDAGQLAKGLAVTRDTGNSVRDRRGDGKGKRPGGFMPTGANSGRKGQPSLAQKLCFRLPTLHSPTRVGYLSAMPEILRGYLTGNGRVAGAEALRSPGGLPVALASTPETAWIGGYAPCDARL